MKLLTNYEINDLAHSGRYYRIEAQAKLATILLAELVDATNAARAKELRELFELEGTL